MIRVACGRSALVPLSAIPTVAFLLAVAPSLGAHADQKSKDPSLSLKSSPPVSFSPSHVTVTAELKGGDGADEEIYCPSVEWDWGDGTRSEAKQDCEPFEEGKSTIKRRYVSTHTFTTAGSYRVYLRLKRGSKTVVAGSTTVQVKPGVRDFSDYPQP